MDIMEANIKAFQATPHSCDAPTASGHYNNCDRSGCGLSTRNIPNSYGPGATFQIDTTKPFDVETTWTANNMITKLRQGANVVTLDHSNCGSSLSGMAAAMTSGMSVRITYWGKNAGNATISNLRITPPFPLQQTTMPTSTATTTSTTTRPTTSTSTTTTTTLPATMFSASQVLLGFFRSFVFGALFTGALGAAISFLVPRVLKYWDPFKGLQTGIPQQRREPHVQRAVALAVVCMIVALIVAWHPLFQSLRSQSGPSSSASPAKEGLNEETPRGPLASISPMSTTLEPLGFVSEGCCSWDGGVSCGETTSYCASAKPHCERDCAGKWKLGN